MLLNKISVLNFVKKFMLCWPKKVGLVGVAETSVLFFGLIAQTKINDDEFIK